MSDSGQKWFAARKTKAPERPSPHALLLSAASRVVSPGARRRHGYFHAEIGRQHSRHDRHGSGNEHAVGALSPAVARAQEIPENQAQQRQQ
jgi:hypothetical protein